MSGFFSDPIAGDDAFSTYSPEDVANMLGVRPRVVNPWAERARKFAEQQQRAEAPVDDNGGESQLRVRAGAVPDETARLTSAENRVMPMASEPPEGVPYSEWARPARPDLTALSYVNPAQFGPAHLALLQRLVNNTWDADITVRGLASRILLGDLWVFEAREPHALVLLATTARNGHLAGELVIEGIAGDGVLARADDIAADIHIIAHHYGATRITTVTAREGWEALGARLGFEPKATIWQMEVDDGRRRTEEH